MYVHLLYTLTDGQHRIFHALCGVARRFRPDTITVARHLAPRSSRAVLWSRGRIAWVGSGF